METIRELKGNKNTRKMLTLSIPPGVISGNIEMRRSTIEREKEVITAHKSQSPEVLMEIVGALEKEVEEAYNVLQEIRRTGGTAFLVAYWLSSQLGLLNHLCWKKVAGEAVRKRVIGIHYEEIGRYRDRDSYFGSIVFRKVMENGRGLRSKKLSFNEAFEIMEYGRKVFVKWCRRERPEYEELVWKKWAANIARRSDLGEEEVDRLIVLKVKEVNNALVENEKVGFNTRQINSIFLNLDEKYQGIAVTKYQVSDELVARGYLRAKASWGKEQMGRRLEARKEAEPVKFVSLGTRNQRRKVELKMRRHIAKKLTSEKGVGVE